ncbi:MAG: holo-ACP synthase [Clostridiales bacterium]|jgi:holo-[acyl-carrier protein] synthase|nr:holo-ACP synthase [Clostridiales bacterium]
MILGLGTDIIEISRIKTACERERFIKRCFTEEEAALFANGKFTEGEAALFANGKFQSVAGNFAAKEAAAKALGTGFSGFSLSDIEVLRDERGKPIINLFNGAKKVFETLGAKHIYVSISHCENYASAVVIIEE